MHIRSLTLENWKCFSDSLHLEFNTIEIFSFPNGSGKTSVLEAIYYGLFGKVDKNKLSAYQNHEGETKVSILFDVDGTEYKINREFPNTSAFLYKDGTLFRSGVREVYNYIDSIFSFNLVKRLWFKGDIAESDVLDFSFFKDEILADQLKTPTELSKYYFQQSRDKNKRAKMITLNDVRDLSDIEKDIDGIKDKLKKKSGVNDSQYRRALQCKEDNESLESLRQTMSDKGYEVIDRDDIRRWRLTNLDSLNREIEAERQKQPASDISSLSHSTLSAVFRANELHGKCVICDGRWDSSRSKYVGSILKSGFRSDERIKELQDQIKFKNSMSQDEIDISEQYYELNKRAAMMPNYKVIIESYNKENDALWARMDELTAERDNAIRVEQLKIEKAKLLKEAEQDKAKASFIKKYIDYATEYYTRSLLERANDILMFINQDYSDLSIEDNSIKVKVRGTNLYISQMSRGERTMVAMSLVYAIRDIFTPSMPLIFDESFASLSEENNNKIIDIIAKSQEQVFVVTHNIDWVESDAYDDSITTIRTEW